MLKRRVIAWSICAGVTISTAGVALGQEYPTKPIRILTGSATGANGIAARVVSQGIAGPLGQQVVVDNRGQGALLEEAVAKASPDGYTLLINGSSFWISPLVRKTA